MGISHVVRGEDHVSNTAAQIQMFAALAAEPPEFAHEALLVGTEGKLAKRLGSLGMADPRAAGIDPVALDALRARPAISEPVEPGTRLPHLVPAGALAPIGGAPARRRPTRLGLPTP